MFMDIIGKNIFHRKLKKPNHPGTIVNIAPDESYIDISFEGDDVSSRRFLVPQSFEVTVGSTPLLHSNDDDLNAWIHNIQLKRLCSICHTHAKKLKLYGDIRVCPYCEKEIVSCHHCEKKIIKSISKSDPWLCGNYFCDDCFPELFKICSICGKVRKSNQIVDSQFFPYDQIVCDFCADEMLTTCDGCNERFPNEQIKTISKYDYCPECYASKTGICDCCKEPSIDLKNGLCEICKAHKAYIDFVSGSDFLDQKTLRICGDKRSMRELRTKRLMSRLNKSCTDNPFDVLILEGYVNYNGRHLDLIIVPGIPGSWYNTLQFSYTMTEFKNDEGYRIRRKIEKVLDDEKSITISIDDMHNLIIMHKAFVLRAMTYADMNYGDRWYGQDYCEEGNKYGDTSDFYIVGAIESLDPQKRRCGYVFFMD